MTFAVALNIIIILIKLERKRHTDALIDSALLVAVAYVFMSSFNALVVGTFASLIVSIYLYIKPPKLDLI